MSYFRVIDVAGQKNQRKKWIHFFDTVTAVIFFSALSEYAECLEEDTSLVSIMYMAAVKAIDYMNVTYFRTPYKTVCILSRR